MRRLFLISILALVAATATAQTSSAVAQDPPIDDQIHRAKMETMTIPSHGSKMNALVYVAAGEGPHPCVILLHGFPGNEKNLDLAQSIRRLGWDTVYFNYRGSWGSQGSFSFGNAQEDVAAVIAYVRDPDNQKTLRVDPKRVVLIGHSMGGMMAISGAAHDPGVMAIGLISGADMANIRGDIKRESNGLRNEGLEPLAGCTAESLAQELMDHRQTWSFDAFNDKIGNRPVLEITSNDGNRRSNDAFVNSLKTLGNNRITSVHFATDHSYSDKRIELQEAVVAWLTGLKGSE